MFSKIKEGWGEQSSPISCFAHAKTTQESLLRKLIRKEAHLTKRQLRKLTKDLGKDLNTCSYRPRAIKSVDTREN